MKKKVLFVTSLYSSSNYIYHILKYGNIQFEYVVASCDVGSIIFNKKKDRHYKIKNFTHLKKIITSFKPDIIFTIPQFYDSIEKKTISFAINNKIKTVSAIDHWYPLVERFKFKIKNKKHKKINLLNPDLIIVNDKKIKNQLKATFKKSTLEPLGNPILEYRWKKVELSKLKSKFIKRKVNKPAITFISEPYSDIDKKFSKFMNPGFNEKEVLNDIIDICINKYEIFIKIHPNEKRKKYSSLQKKLRIIENENIDDLLCFSHKVIGMGSLLIYETALIRNDVISYRPNEKFPFHGNSVKATILCKDKESLIKNINTKKKKINLTANLYEGSINNIVKLIEEF